MWQLLKIPQTLHLYWGGHRLSYLRYLTIHTFQKLNPDWRVLLHVPRVISDARPRWHTYQQKDSCVEHDYMDRVDTEIIVHDFSDYDFDDHAHEVHKSDFLRWRLLAHVGGVWSDIDIIYVRPMNCLPGDAQILNHADTVLCPLMPPKKHTVGFLMSSPDNEFFNWMHKCSKGCYDPELYQCMGSDILNQRFDSLESFAAQWPHNRFMFLDPVSVYSVTSKDIGRLYRPTDSNTRKKLERSEVIGFHWFGGHPMSQQLENQLTADNRQEFDCFLKDIIDKAMA